MSYTEKQTMSSAGSFVLRRHSESQEFVCDRDLRPKKAKIVVGWTTVDGVKRTICNSCYSSLLQQG